MADKETDYTHTNGGGFVVAGEDAERMSDEQALRESEQSLATELDVARRLQELSMLLSQAGGATEALYNRILDTVLSILNADFASIQILHPERGPEGELELVADRGFTQSSIHALQTMPLFSRSAARWARSPCTGVIRTN